MEPNLIDGSAVAPVLQAFRRFAAFAAAEGFEIVAEFNEVETGKGTDALDLKAGGEEGQVRGRGGQSSATACRATSLFISGPDGPAEVCTFIRHRAPGKGTSTRSRSGRQEIAGFWSLT